MRRALFLVLIASLLTLSASRAGAVVCAVDEVPGATLLLPYFEVDLNGGQSGGGFVAVHNASPQPVLTHLTIWSDLGVAVLDFDLFLKGLGSVQVDLRGLFEGKLPSTPLDPGTFPSCASSQPLPPLPASFVTHLRSALTGKFSSIFNGCAGRDLGDNVARGYLTIDTVSRCAFLFPSDPNYFKNGGLGVATNQNVLWGDAIGVSPTNLALGQRLIALEASGSNPQTSASGQYTFYGRLVGWSGADNREPLATFYGARVLGGLGATAGTDLVVWRDPRTAVKAFPCPAASGQPAWFPLPSRAQVVDDAGQAMAAGNLLFPAVTQRVNLQRVIAGLPTSGTLRLDLNTHTAARVPAGPAEAPTASQGWVTALVGDQGLVVDLGSVKYDSACAPGQTVSPP